MKKRNKNFLLILSRSKKKKLCGKLALFRCIFLNKKRNYEPEFAKEIIKQKPNLVKMQL